MFVDNYEEEFVIIILKSRQLDKLTVLCKYKSKCVILLSSKMEKLPMCRICLVDNVHMYVVVNKNLHELYEKLTDTPFVTKDSRPILACFVCCAQLKKCYRLLTKCLEAEERFAQIINGNYELKPLLNQDHLELFHGFIKSPIQIINIDDVGQAESIAVKEELQADYEGLDDIFEPNEEHSSDDDDLKTVNLYDNYLDIEDTQLQSHHSESDSEEKLPLLGFETELVEEPEVSEKKRKAKKTNRAPVPKKPKLVTRRTKLEDTITPEIKKAALKIQSTQNRTSTPFINTKPRVENSIHNIALDMNCRSNSNQDFKRFKCETCQSCFRQRSHLRSHIFIHAGEKPYKCYVCHRSFKSNSALSAHTRIHTGDKPYKCDVCHRSFTQNNALSKHLRIHSSERLFKCDVCQRSFRQHSTLSMHIRIHTGEKPYKCDVCQRSFRQHSALSMHIRIHTGEKPYKCDVCQRSFRQNSALSRHIQIHTGEKPYKCDVCQRSFRQNSALSRHIRIHTGKKPYKCDVCQRSFRQKDKLSQHVIRIHTLEKPYKCEVCQLTFSEKINLRCHSRIHTGEKP